MHILKDEIQQVASEWNNHPIRPSSPAVPSGSPEELFFMPVLSTGAQNFLQPFHRDDVEYIHRFATDPGSPLPYEFLMAAEVLMRENSLQMPLNVHEALDFYLELKFLLHEELV
jgi:hypothetical protein